MYNKIKPPIFLSLIFILIRYTKFSITEMLKSWSRVDVKLTIKNADKNKRFVLELNNQI